MSLPEITISSEISSRASEVAVPIMRRLLDGVLSGSLDDVGEGYDPEEDSPFERTLCAAWDVATVAEYATAMEINNFHRVLLKITVSTKRARTRELAMGAMASLASHWEPVGLTLLNDMDILKLARSILWHENDARVLLETTRLLNTFFLRSIDATYRTIIEHDHLTQFLTPVPMTPSVFHQYTQIICNTLHAELLIMSLELMTRIVVYTNAIVYSLAREAQQRQPDENMYIEKSDAMRLVDWGTQRLEEEQRGLGIGMGFNRGVAKNIMHLLWAILAYNVIQPKDCDLAMIQSLDNSMCRLVSYIQEDQDEFESRGGDDDDIQNLAEALSNKLSVTDAM
ncbi:hypothetical protein VTP01DRAFT_8045 [Rhizomucor pusillus]|uniref:uncharacterized protein n=1 Tax=Rhizomucor pusillus TaxID=4840 RepID=UPI003742BD89